MYLSKCCNRRADRQGSYEERMSGINRPDKCAKCGKDCETWDAFEALDTLTSRIATLERDLAAAQAEVVRLSKVQKAVLAQTVACAGRVAADIAKLYAEKGSNFDGDTAEAAILNTLCDPDDPDTVRIVSRILGKEAARG